MDVEIYNPLLGYWELDPPLPLDFRSGNSSYSLSSSLFKGRLCIFGIHSCFVFSFDLHHSVWSEVRILRPPRVVFSFLIVQGKILCFWNSLLLRESMENDPIMRTSELYIGVSHIYREINSIAYYLGKNECMDFISAMSISLAFVVPT